MFKYLALDFKKIFNTDLILIVNYTISFIFSKCLFSQHFIYLFQFCDKDLLCVPNWPDYVYQDGLQIVPIFPSAGIIQLLYMSHHNCRIFISSLLSPFHLIVFWEIFNKEFSEKKKWVQVHSMCRTSYVLSAYTTGRYFMFTSWLS